MDHPWCLHPMSAPATLYLLPSLFCSFLNFIHLSLSTLAYPLISSLPLPLHLFLHLYFLSFSVCLSLLTVAIIKSCPVRYVAHGCYWCPFITHYRWVPVLVLTSHKMADTHTHTHTFTCTVAHTHTSRGQIREHTHTNTMSTATDSRKMEDCIVSLNLVGVLPVADKMTG